MAKRNLVIKEGNTRIEAVCGKCGAPNRLSAECGASRVKFACKNCGHKQKTLWPLGRCRGWISRRGHNSLPRSSSLRGAKRRSNPDRLRGRIVDCFASLAM